MKRSVHYILFFVTLALTVAAGILMLHVNVNADMTKYLPDDSQTSQGLAILTDEFGEIPNMKGDVEAMFKDLSNEEREAFADSLRAISEVETVRMQVSQDSVYTLYDMNVPKSVDQKKLGQREY